MYGSATSRRGISRGHLLYRSRVRVGPNSFDSHLVNRTEHASATRRESLPCSDAIALIFDRSAETLYMAI
jgi:hypothetical protein